MTQTSKGPLTSIRPRHTSTHEKEEIIKSLKAKHSYGYDEIPTTILKISALFSSPLTHICNGSLFSGIFPTRLKFSVVKPIFKSGDKYYIVNYRPISLLTAFSKVFEKVIYIRLYQHLNQNNILTSNQYGFRNNSTTNMASFELINEILLAMNNKLTIDGIFCDLEKAFCVNHNILLSKLEVYGRVGVFKALITSYLCDRYQRVVLDNKKLIIVFFRIGRSLSMEFCRAQSLSTVFFYYTLMIFLM
jgi:hypothetical protein